MANFLSAKQLGHSLGVSVGRIPFPTGNFNPPSAPRRQRQLNGEDVGHLTSTGLGVREQAEAHLMYYYSHTHCPVRPQVRKPLLTAARIEAVALSNC